jgi:hypothetical protein
MQQERELWASPHEDLPGGAAGHLLVRERNDADGTRRAWVSWVQETGGRRVPKPVPARPVGLHPLGPSMACL